MKHQRCYHKETSQMICRANQLTGFYMMRSLALNELILDLQNHLIVTLIISDKLLDIWPCLNNSVALVYIFLVPSVRSVDIGVKKILQFHGGKILG